MARMLDRLDRRWQDQAPRVESREDGDYFVVPNTGMSAKPMGTEGAMINKKVDGSGIESAKGYRFSDQRPGSYDPAARIIDQDSQGIVGEVIYPGWLIVHSIQDFDLKAACVRAYNDWLFDDFCSHAPHRLLGAGVIPVGRGPIEAAIAEAQRSVERGAHSLMLPQTVPGMSWGDEHFEPMWAALEELGVPVGFHQAAGQVAVFEDKMAPGAFWTTAIGNKISLGWVFMQLVFGGVPERHPNLKFVLVEGGIGWIGFQLTLMDHLFGDHHQWIDPHLSLKPSEYFWRQFWATFEDDRAGILTLPLLDPSHVMWAGDYPHTEGNYPFGQEYVARDLEGVPDDVIKMITFDNARDLYGFAPALV